MIKPLENRILVRLIPPVEESEGGIYIPGEKTGFSYDQTGEMVRQGTQGEVVAIGPGKRTKKGKRLPVEGVSIGDIVCFSDTCTRKVDDEHVFIRDDDIIGIMKAPSDIHVVYRDNDRMVM